MHASGNVRTNGTAWDTRFLFQGRQYYKEATIYDYRNRFYNPGLGRFLQSDPLGFGGGDANLFRYCGGDPVNRIDPTGLDVEEGFHLAGVLPHHYFGITDPNSGTNMRWFDFFPTENPFYSQGQWSSNTGQPGGFHNIDTIHTTPEQDLVILNAFYNATDNPGTFILIGGNCYDTGTRILQDALGPQATQFNPVDPYTGNIFDAQGNWAGWENPDTGNIYDSEGDWAGWNPNWNSDSGAQGAGASPSGYGTASGYGGGNYVGVGPNGFGGLGSGFGGIGGGFNYGGGGLGFGGVGNNSAGVGSPPPKKLH